MGRSEAGFVNWGPASQGWGQASRVERQESWVPGQALLQAPGVSWPQFSQLSKHGLDILEFFHERTVREKGQDVETSGLGVQQTWAPSHPESLAKPPKLFLSPLLPLYSGPAGAAGNQEMPSAPATPPLRPHHSLCVRGVAAPPRGGFADFRTEDSSGITIGPGAQIGKKGFF